MRGERKRVRAILSLVRLGASPRAHLELAQQLVRLGEEVERVDEDDGHAPRGQQVQAVQQVEDDHVAQDERAREGRALEVVHRGLQRGHRLLLAPRTAAIDRGLVRRACDLRVLPSALAHGALRCGLVRAPGALPSLVSGKSVRATLARPCLRWRGLAYAGEAPAGVRDVLRVAVLRRVVSKWPPVRACACGPTAVAHLQVGCPCCASLVVPDPQVGPLLHGDARAGGLQPLHTRLRIQRLAWVPAQQHAS